MNKKNYIKIDTRMNSKDFNLFKSIFNQGIDSRLETFTKSKYYYGNEVFKKQYLKKEYLYYNHINKLVNRDKRFIFLFHNDEIQILLRRLLEICNDDNDIDYWIDDIVSFVYNINL